MRPLGLTHTYDYSYDENDNRLTSSETGVVATFNYDAGNRLTTSTDGQITTYGYSSNGNLTEVDEPGKASYTMTYDKENRLVRHETYATGVLISTTTYTYDGDGLKRSEIVDGWNKTYLWGGADYLGEV